MPATVLAQDNAVPQCVHALLFFAETENTPSLPTDAKPPKLELNGELHEMLFPDNGPNTPRNPVAGPPPEDLPHTPDWQDHFSVTLTAT